MSGFLKQNGGYRDLIVFKITTVIYDLTVFFTEKYIAPGSRTKDQMIQAARSGRQNIAEGSMASTTSLESEIKLTNVAKASLEELLLDYEDYLRQSGLQQWPMKYHRSIKLREFLLTDTFMCNYHELFGRLNAEEICNMAITLINRATFLLRKLLESQQENFLRNGGIREQMTKARKASFRKDSDKDKNKDKDK